VQGEIIARRDRRLSNGSRPTRSRSIPTSCSNCRTGESYGPTDEAASPASIFPIHHERVVAPLLRSLVLADRHAGAQIYDREGVLLLEAATYMAAGGRAALRSNTARRRTTELETRRGSRSRTGSGVAICRPTAILGRPTAKAIRGSQGLGGVCEGEAKCVVKDERRGDRDGPRCRFFCSASALWRSVLLSRKEREIDTAGPRSAASLTCLALGAVMVLLLGAAGRAP